MVQVLAETAGLPKTEWLKLRQKGIGGSDVAAILGLSKFRSSLHVFEEKTAETIAEEEDNEAMYWGRRHEDMLREEFMERNAHLGFEVRKLDKILQHPEYPWAIANVDGIILAPNGGAGILECKTSSEWLFDQWKDEQVPMYYLTQLQWYLFVADLDWGYFSTLIGGNKYRSPRIERDDELINLMFDRCSVFWHNHVLTGTPPQPDGSEATTAYLKEKYAAADPESLAVLDEDEDDWAAIMDRLQESNAAIKHWEAISDECKNRIRDRMKGAQAAVYRGQQIATWKEQPDTRFDLALFSAHHPDLYDQYINRRMIRKFLPKKWRA